MEKNKKNLNIYNKIKKKIKDNRLIIGVIGLGYVGLPISLSFALKKFKVIGLDNDINKISQLKKGKSYINSVSVNIIKKTLNKNFFPTTNIKNIRKCDAIIVCVPTPIDKNKKPIMNYIDNVILKIKKYIKKNQIIILECTSYPGTTEEYFLPIFKKKNFNIGNNIFLGYSPEREDPGNNKFSVIKGNLPKVVSGYTKNCSSLIEMLYLKIINRVYLTENIMSAEFSKLLENIYRSVNISLVNELTIVAKKLKLNIYDIINAAKTKPFGFQSFFPGPGVGGHCIPVDPHFLSWKAKKLGINLNFIKLAGRINDERPLLLCKEIKKYLNKLKFKKNKYKIVIFGVSYKKNSDDIRESPSTIILKNLKKINNQLKICDPILSEMSKKVLKNYEFVENKDYYNFDKKNDVAIIITNHSIFDYNKIRKNFKLIFDCRNSFKEKQQNIIQI